MNKWIIHPISAGVLFAAELQSTVSTIKEATKGELDGRTGRCIYQSFVAMRLVPESTSLKLGDAYSYLGVNK